MGVDQTISQTVDYTVERGFREAPLCRAHVRLQAHIVTQADGMQAGTPFAGGAVFP
jgi:hypothetical protein